MVSITSYSSASSSLSSTAQTQSTQQAASSDTTTTVQTEESSSASSSVSSLARLLADAATRAEERDSSLSREELAQKASSINKFLVQASYTANRAKYATETPDSDDPARLAQAQQATDYVNENGSNPFKGLSYDQLTLIIYDESGDFTVNERIAAWDEAYDQEQVYRRAAAARAVAEYNSTFKITDALNESLDYYENLPLIEQVQYPEDYATKRQAWIESESNRVVATDDNSLTQQLERLLMEWRTSASEVNSGD